MPSEKWAAAKKFRAATRNLGSSCFVDTKSRSIQAILSRNIESLTQPKSVKIGVLGGSQECEKSVTLGFGGQKVKVAGRSTF